MPRSALVARPRRSSATSSSSTAPRAARARSQAGQRSRSRPSARAIPTLPRFDWNVFTFIGFKTSRDDGESLFVYTVDGVGDDGDWGVIAVSGQTGASPQAVLDNHAHKLIGTFPTQTEAMSAAERFATEWIAGASIEACTCTELAASS